MMRRVLDFFKGLGSMAIIVGLVVGVPWFGAPYTMNRFEFIRSVFGDQLASESAQIEAALTGLLIAILWIGWAMIVMSLAVEIVNQIRGRAAPSLPVFPGVQAFSRQLVAATTLVFASFSAMSPAVAAATMPTPVPATLEMSSSFADVSTPTLPTTGPMAFAGVETSGVVGEGSDLAEPTHVVEHGETWWSLAEDHLGDGMRWQEIRDANVGRVNPDGSTITAETEFVQVGWNLAIPGAESSTAGPVSVLGSDVFADDVPSAVEASEAQQQEWVVDTGEHFWMKSEQALIDGWGRQPTEAEIRSHWIDVQAANVNLISSGDTDLIFPGEELVMPAVPADPLAPVEAEVDGLVETPEAEEVVEVEPEPVVEEASELPETELDGVGIPGAPNTPVETPPSSVPTPTTTAPSSVPADTTDQAAAVDSGLAGSGLGASTAAVAFGAAGVLLATYKVMRLEKVRRKFMAKRKHGESPAPVDDELAELDQELRFDVNNDLVQFLGGAWRSLANRPIPEANDAAQPVLSLRDGNVLQVLMSRDDTRAPSPWTCNATHGTEAIWSLDVNEETFDIVDEQQSGSIPLMVAVGEDVFVNLEATGPVGLSGDPSRMAGLARSLMLEATSAPWADGVDVRVTESAASQLGLASGAESAAEIARSVDVTATWMLDTLDTHNVSNIYAARSQMEAEAHPTLIVCDKSDTDSLLAILEVVRQRRVSLGMIVLNETNETYTGVLDEGGGLIFGPSRLRCRSAFAAADLGDLFTRLERQRAAIVPPPMSMPEPIVATAGSAELTVPDDLSELVHDQAVVPGHAGPAGVPDFAQNAVDQLPEAATDDVAPTEPPTDKVRVPEYLMRSIEALNDKRTAGEPVEDQGEVVVPDPVASGEPEIDLTDEQHVAVGAPVDAPPAVPQSQIETVPPTPAAPAVEPLTVRVLGDVQVVGDAVSLSRQELSVMTFLAVEGDQNASAIKRAIYGPNAEVKEPTFKALIGRFRKKVGKERFPEVTDGRYRLVGVRTDYAEFSDLASRARNSDDDAEALDLFMQAAMRVAGQPFGPDAGVDAWAWIDSADNHPRCHMSARVGDALLEGSRLALQMGRFSDALEIIERAKVANPYSEELVCLHVEVLLNLGQRGAAERIVTAYEQRFEDEFQEERPDGPRAVLNELRIAS